MGMGLLYRAPRAVVPYRAPLVGVEERALQGGAPVYPPPCGLNVWCWSWLGYRCGTQCPADPARRILGDLELKRHGPPRLL